MGKASRRRRPPPAAAAPPPAREGPRRRDDDDEVSTSTPTVPKAPVGVRALYREGSGTLHFDWPVAKIRQAVDDPGGTLWVDVLDPCGEPDHAVEAILRDIFGFHPLAIEDAMKESHVPRVDDWGDYLYLVFHSIDFDEDTHELRLHELDVFLGKNYVLTYHNQPLGFVEQVRRNVERDPANRFKHGADHLLYHLLDMAVADYLPAIEHLDTAIDDAQDEVFANPTPQTLQDIFLIKRAALRLHRVLAPQREVLNRLARDPYDPIAEEHRVYFRDIYDHLVRIHDLTEGLRDLISGALDTYLSAISNRTNEIMKALTIVTVLFLPMSFLTGFFGMNFFGDDLALPYHLPRRALFWGSCVVMVASVVVQWYVARRRGWI